MELLDAGLDMQRLIPADVSLKCKHEQQYSFNAIKGALGNATTAAGPQPAAR